MKNEALISKLNECVAACNYCADVCLDEDSVQSMVNCIRTDRKCAIVCNALAQVLTIDNQNASELIAYCEKICKECADECEKHDMEHCQKCAKACRKCAEACAEVNGVSV